MGKDPVASNKTQHLFNYKKDALKWCEESEITAFDLERLNNNFWRVTVIDKN